MLWHENVIFQNKLLHSYGRLGYCSVKGKPVPIQSLSMFTNPAILPTQLAVMILGGLVVILGLI